MTLSTAESKPLRERWLPQASLRFFLVLIGFSAMVMYILRAAFVGDHLWAKIASLLMVTVGATFVAYAILFLLANVFTASTAPLVRSSESPPFPTPAPCHDDTSDAGGDI